MSTVDSENSESFAVQFEARLRDVARKATKLGDGETVLLSMISAAINFAFEGGLPPDEVVGLLRRCADEIEERRGQAGAVVQ